MKATLLRITPDAEALIAEAARLSHSGHFDLVKGVILDDTADGELIRKIISWGHESPLEHAVATFLIEGISRTCSHQLVRHRLCVTGDSVIMSYVPKKRYPHKEWTVEELYSWQLDAKRKGRIKLIKTRSVDESTKLLVENRILKIVKTGVAETVTIKTKSGRHITLTPDHPVYTPFGYIAAGELAIGSVIYSNGVDALTNRDWLYDMYIAKNNTLKELADLIGVCVSTVQKALRGFGIKKPLSIVKNRKPGRGKKGAVTADGRKRLSDMHKGHNNKMWAGDNVKDGGARKRGRVYLNSICDDVCEGCGKAGLKLETHHINKNIRDNSRENLRHLCSSCHHCWHHPSGMSVFMDEVVSVAPSGRKDVYDIEMVDEPRNFVANGIVLHNCSFTQRSSRYCLSDEPMVYPDEDKWSDGAKSEFHDAIEHARLAYQNLVQAGVPKEDARFVLPQAESTSLVMTANLREWRHIFKLRCDRHAQWEIRRLCESMLAELSGRAPNVFADLIQPESK